jgi:hypothetical protein
MKKVSLLSIILLIAATVSAQSIEELKTILDKSKDRYIKPETLDQLMISLRVYREHPLPDQDSLMLETYQSISSAYSANLRFKQGLNAYNLYLAYKEEMLSKDKEKALNTTMNSIGERTRNDENELKALQYQLSELKKDNTALTRRVVLFKTYFSFILIALSVIFAVILVSYRIRSGSLRSRLNQNRASMKNIHHLALTGRYEEGVRTALQNSIQNVHAEIEALKKLRGA